MTCWYWLFCAKPLPLHDDDADLMKAILWDIFLLMKTPTFDGATGVTMQRAGIFSKREGRVGGDVVF